MISWKEFAISVKKWHFEIFHWAKASTLTMSTGSCIFQKGLKHINWKLIYTGIVNYDNTVAMGAITPINFGKRAKISTIEQLY